MERIMLDSSVYGRLVDDIELTEKFGKLIPKDFVVYGNKTIRDELKETPRNVRLKSGSKKLLLLRIYDSLIRKDHHDLKHNKLIETLAGDYFKEYRKEKGFNPAFRTYTEFKKEIIRKASRYET